MASCTAGGHGNGPHGLQLGRAGRTTTVGRPGTTNARRGPDGVEHGGAIGHHGLLRLAA